MTVGKALVRSARVARSSRVEVPFVAPVVPVDTSSYFDFRDHLSTDLRHGLAPIQLDQLVDRAAISRDQAAEWVERFMSDMVRYRSSAKP